ncbi:MAG: hypothetical protein ACFHW5_04650 [Verrucomicrobiota bacterium]
MRNLPVQFTVAWSPLNPAGFSTPQRAYGPAAAEPYRSRRLLAWLVGMCCRTSASVSAQRSSFSYTPTAFGHRAAGRFRFSTRFE